MFVKQELEEIIIINIFIYHLIYKNSKCFTIYRIYIYRIYTEYIEYVQSYNATIILFVKMSVKMPQNLMNVFNIRVK